jgi:uncharacterized membrane protein
MVDTSLSAVIIGYVDYRLEDIVYSLSASHSTFDIWYFFSATMIILLSYSSVSEWSGNFMIEKKCK